MKKGFTLAEVSMTKRTSGIENKVLHSRESETKEPSRNIIKLCAFTLAEVLITLAIIGVVAALTIPVLVHKYQQKQLYTQFIKMYNTITNAVNLSTAENGAPGIWAYDESNLNATAEQYVVPYLKVISECNVTDSNCGNYELSLLSGQKPGATFAYFAGMSDGAKILTLSDGSTVSVGPYGEGQKGLSSVTFAFDTNGAKGPNTAGRDVFFIRYERDSVRDSNGVYHEKWVWTATESYTQGGTPDPSNSSVMMESNCDPSSHDESNGMGCAGRLLLEGKMSY